VHAWVDETLAALADTAETRARLDASERRMVASARAGGATWAQVAAALGLQSRQAAEQRWQRLGGGATPRLGVDVDRLRALMALLHNRLVRSTVDDAAVRLARSTLDVAADAAPGALHDLAAHAVDDLRAAAADAVPAPVRQLADRVWAAARPQRGG
jgi:hypothetical protein